MLVKAAGAMTLVHGGEVSGRALVQTRHSLLVLESHVWADAHRQTCDPQSQPFLCVHRCLEGSAWHPCAQAQPRPGWESTVRGTASQSSVHLIGWASSPPHRPSLGPAIGLWDPRVGAVEVTGEVPGTQKEDRLLSSGLRSLRMSTPGRPCSAHHGPRHAGGGSLHGPSCNSVAPSPVTTVHGNSIWLCIQAMRDAILLWGLVL